MVTSHALNLMGYQQSRFYKGPFSVYPCYILLPVVHIYFVLLPLSKEHALRSKIGESAVVICRQA